MRSALTGFALVYYETGSIHTEANSDRVWVEGGNREVDYKFRLPEGPYSFLRFDPIDRPGNVMVLSRLQIVTGAGQLVRAIEPKQVKATQQIERIESDATSVSLTTSATEGDPMLRIELGEPLFLKSFARDSWRTYTRRFLLSFLLASTLGLVLAPTLRQAKIAITARGCGAKIRTWSTNHPQQAVLAMAALSVILSCYPVVFFGKSFVSPNNHSHTFLLYSEMPTVPGYKDVATDDEKGSDLGATMWQNWPYSVVQARALFKYGELPLWNRYNATGRPLLGQGLSMCGDPLQWVVLVTRGASAAWDLKYILAKFLFAACLGLTVLQAARHLPAALIIAASASFIGFFSYRYSHPAFFTLCYAPAILLCWFKLIDSRPGKVTAVWLGIMVLADWTLLNSGGPKEAYVLFLMLNFCGFLALLLGRSIVGGKGVKLFQLFLVKVLFVAIAMPIWLTFFHALQNSFTAYDAGGVAQIKPGLLIGLFDDIFYRQFNRGEDHLDPSLNFLTLLALLWFIFSPRQADPRKLSRSLAITGLIALAFVYGLVPAQWIMRVPLLKSIIHIDNTFSCVAIVCLLVLAGFGIKAFWNDARSVDFNRTCLRVWGFFAFLAAFYLGTAEAWMRSSLPMGGAIPKSNFFWGYSLSLLLAVALAPRLGRTALMTKSGRGLSVISLILFFVLLHWRHGMHLSTPFDAYVMNPQRRIDLTADSSAALQLIKARAAEPSRAIGFDWAFSPGYGGVVDVEQIDGPDPLLTKHYQTLMDLSGVKLLFGRWRVSVGEDHIASAPLLFNMLNLRYYLGPVGPHLRLAPSIKRIAALDMDVYESERAWPRAFFTDRLVAYQQEAEFLEFIKTGDGTPFAAIPAEELNKQKELTDLVTSSVSGASHQMTPARDYVLTSNTTSFKVTASGPGVVVLTEAFVPGDFQVRLNGKAASYFRVNSAFKGLFVDKAGDYIVSYAYWPRYFTFSLIVAAAGVTVLLLWLAIMSKGPVQRKVAS